MIIPIGLKDKFNRTSPADDAANFGAAALAPEPARLLNALFKLGVKETGRTDIVQALLTGVPGLTQIGSKPVPADTLKVNLGVPPSATPNRFGVLANDVAGFPNGRRLTDDVVDIELRVIAGALLQARAGRQADPARGRRRHERQAVPHDVPVRRAARLGVRLEAQASRARPRAGAPAAGLTDPRGQARCVALRNGPGPTGRPLPMTAHPSHRALAVLVSFAAALAAFLLLRGAEPPSPRAGGAGAVAPSASRPAREHRREIARLQGARARRAARHRPARAARRRLPPEGARDRRSRASTRAPTDCCARRSPRKPGDADALVASAGLALSRHDFRRGLALARRARAARPAALAAYPALVDALVELGRFGAAERALQRLVDAKPALAAYARVSYLRELHGDLDGAVAAMRRAIDAGGPTPESVAAVQSLLGGLELARGRPDAAERRAPRRARRGARLSGGRGGARPPRGRARRPRRRDPPLARRWPSGCRCPST